MIVRSTLIAAGCAAVSFVLLAVVTRAPQTAVREPVAPARPSELAEAPLPAEAAVQAPEEEQVASVEAQATERLAKLGELLLERLEREGTFPAGTFPAADLPAESRLSWLATLADRFETRHPPAIWDHPWHDPVNEPFVRRRLLEFQNPALETLTGADGYPATHFAGVAGVGSDAAQLPIGDPRAGIFGDERTTRLADIRDGAANTWLVLGVRDRLGSWAAGGQATVRGLAREPYVNGPDGFGTGQSDSMLVLLADGRVQAVSASADPRILRSLAAMADGGTTDSAEVPEPGNHDLAIDDTPGLSGESATDSESADPPLEPEFAPEPRRYDLAAALRQPILHYEQLRPRPLSELLPGLSELVGAPIVVDPAEQVSTTDRLSQSVKVKLEKTTVSEILESLLKPAGLTYRVQNDHLELMPRE